MNWITLFTENIVQLIEKFDYQLMLPLAKRANESH